jgi:hypothetical protein
MAFVVIFLLEGAASVCYHKNEKAQNVFDDKKFRNFWALVKTLASASRLHQKRKGK